MSIKMVMPSNHLILCHPLLLPSISLSIRVFSNESALHVQWPKYWSFSFSFSISLSNEHPGLISFRMDWLDPFAVQGTLKSLLQHHSSKSSILWILINYKLNFRDNVKSTTLKCYFLIFLICFSLIQNLFLCFFNDNSYIYSVVQI